MSLPVSPYTLLRLPGTLVVPTDRLPEIAAACGVLQSIGVGADYVYKGAGGKSYYRANESLGVISFTPMSNADCLIFVNPPTEETP